MSLMQILAETQTGFYGVDKDGDALTRFRCGHVLGYPAEMIVQAAEAGAGLRLDHTACGLTEWIEAEHVRDLREWLRTAPSL